MILVMVRDWSFCNRGKFCGEGMGDISYGTRLEFL